MSTAEATETRVEERVASLAAALEGQRLARIREEAAAQVAAEEVEAERLARINAVAAALPDQLKAAGVEAAEKKLMVAIGAYVEAVTVYSDALGAAWTELMRCEPLPAGFAAKVGNGSVRLNGVNYPQLDAQGGIVALARTAISAKSPRTALRLTVNR